MRGRLRPLRDLGSEGAIHPDGGPSPMGEEPHVSTRRGGFLGWGVGG